MRRPSALPRAYKQRAPTTYTPELGDKICAHIKDGLTLNQTAQRLRINESTVRTWVVFDVYPDFTANYGRARLVGYHKMADDLIQESQDPGWTEIRTYQGRKLVSRVKREATERARLVADNKKWLLSKALPKVYGRDIGKDDEGGAAADLINQPYVVTIPPQFGSAEEWMASLPPPDPDPTASE
jgi:hypothetical protein